LKTFFNKKNIFNKARFYKFFENAILLMSFSVFLSSSCSKDDGGIQNDNNFHELKIKTVNIVGTSVKSAPDLVNGEIGIFRLKSSGYSSIRSNVKYTIRDGIWSAASETIPVYLTKSDAELCAYYPYSPDISDGKIVLLSQLYSPGKDLCYRSEISASSSSPEVSIELQHAYAKLVFNLKHNASYTGDCAISDISITNAGILKSNTLDITDVSAASGSSGTYDSGTAGTVTIDPSITSIASGDSTTVSFLMVPTLSSLSGKIELSFTVDGNTLTSEIDTDSTTGFTTLEAGKEYDISVEIGEKGVTSTANCYMIAPGASLTIPVNVRGNGGAVAETGLNTNISPASVGIVWETSQNLITLGSLSSNKKITVTANGNTPGNAVIAAYSGENLTGDILWSWHIWITDYDPDSTPTKNGNIYTILSTNGSYTWMDRNLGAIVTTYSADNNMLHYQWGRKDPFPYTTVVGSSTTVDVSSSYASIYTIDNSIQHPFTFIIGSSDWLSTANNYLWGGNPISAPTDKTIFDPCPAGWRVPAYNGSSTASLASPWSCITTSSYVSWSSSVGTFANNGVAIVSIGNSFWPAAGSRAYSVGSQYSAGSLGYYWSASPNSSYGYLMGFDSSGMYPTSGNRRANGFSVRCVKE
jgi:uncharacterized protein (TIGR02145 family)